MPMATKDAQREYQRNWIHKRRSSWISEHGPCKDCGSWDDLEVDHIDPSKKEINVSQLWSRKKSIRDKELSKCQVLCRECHVQKTNKDNGWPIIEPSYKMRNGAQKLTEPDVIEIKQRLNKGEPQKSIAKDFDVKVPAISKINTGMRWADVKI